MAGVRFAVETWAPEYGAAVEDTDPVASAESVDVEVEVAAASWAPRPPAAGLLPGVVRFVDGVRRIEARVWITAPGGVVHQGICASYAAGVVSCDGAAKVEAAQVRRTLFARADGAVPVATRHGTFGHRAVAGDGPDQLSLALQDAMAELEHEVSVEAASADAVLVVDGPLRERHRLPGAVGYVKTHHRSYLPEPLLPVIGRLAAGERTPLLLIEGRSRRWSWYLRLPGERAHAWAGVVRCEISAASTTAVVDAASLADQVTRTLPRFASAPHKDGRAPQNLYPIAGLERELRRRLGDTNLLQRALRQAARSG
jgi:hypothetical protein